MTITLPLDTIPPFNYRIQVKERWNWSWRTLTSQKLHGSFLLEEFWRSCLPEPGQMIFKYDIGLIDNYVYGTDLFGNETEDVDLLGYAVRLQVDPGSNDPGYTPTYATAWVGVVEHQEDSVAPGSISYLIGTRRYFCQDLLASYSQRWMLDHFGFTSGTFTVPYSFGLKGYNQLGWDGKVIGNKGGALSASDLSSTPFKQDGLSTAQAASFLSKLKTHGYAGVTGAFSDLEVVEHALSYNRQPFSPYFEVTGATGLLSQITNSWPVAPGMRVWDMLARVCDRRRGRGAAFLDWSESNPDAEFDHLYLRVNPQTKDDISVQDPTPGGTTITIAGATTAATTTTVDLTGDPRNVHEVFSLGDRNQANFDIVETCGEPLEVLVNLSFDTSLEKRWDTSEATSFQSATVDKRKLGRYDAVFQLVGLKSGWDCLVDDAAGGAKTRCDYRCGDSGEILMPSGAADTAPNVIAVNNDVPLFVGYKYDGSSPARYDGQTEKLAPARRPLAILLKDPNNTDRYIRADEAFGISVRSLGEYGLLVNRAGDYQNGARFLADISGIGAGQYTYKHLVFVAGLTLPHRVRLESSRGAALGLRKQTIYVPGIQCWLAHPSAIWDLSDGSLSGSSAPNAYGASGLRNACLPYSGAQYGLIRDDRAKLAVLHGLACSWYLGDRRTATWSLRANGFLPSFQNETTTNGVTTTSSVTYPTLGQLITTLTQGGVTYNINTPVTKIHFSMANNGVTTWVTDHGDLDLR